MQTKYKKKRKKTHKESVSNQPEISKRFRSKMEETTRDYRNGSIKTKMTRQNSISKINLVNGARKTERYPKGLNVNGAAKKTATNVFLSTIQT